MIKSLSQVYKNYAFQYLIFIFLSLFLFSYPAKASVKVFENDLFAKVLINGEINNNTVIEFNEAVEKVKTRKKTILWILLNSEGGSVDAAIAIGRSIRKQNLIVKNQGVCYSSCVLIYIAAVHRYNYKDSEIGKIGKQSGSIIGLHRPYFGGASSETIHGDAIKLMYEKVKNYIAEMGVSERLFELMYNTPPEKILKIKGEEIEKIVPIDDPEYDEKQVQKKAMEYGISSVEYRERRQALRNMMLNPKSRCLIDYNCEQAFYWGISESDFEKRIDEWQSRCRHVVTPEERKEFASLNEFERFKNSAFKRLLECRIQVMRGK